MAGGGGGEKGPFLVWLAAASPVFGKRTDHPEHSKTPPVSWYPFNPDGTIPRSPLLEIDGRPLTSGRNPFPDTPELGFGEGSLVTGKPLV